MKRTLNILWLIVWMMGLLSGCARSHWDAQAVLVKGPRIDEQILARISPGSTTKEDVEKWLGEPTFELAVTNGEILIYRELQEAVSGTAYFGWASTPTEYTTYEEVLLLEIVAGKVVGHRTVNRVYFLPAKDVDFALDDTAYDKYGIVKNQE